MKLYCKVVYKDSIEPTVYYEEELSEKALKEIHALLDTLVHDESINGIFIGKSG